ncbi:MAG TPA: serine/threonine-protein kinase [Kofleriaceae bacterium]|nr:serine/threonine-protein kinase [Kofleriaceae bacterium]
MADLPEAPDEDASTNVNTPPPGRPALKRRITRPSYMVELTEGSMVGEYEVQSQIGEGAMGTVFMGVHPLIGKRVAIKVLKPELCANQASIDRFVQEAQAVNKIGHPNIVDVFSLGELEDGRAYFVMEFLRGEDLKVKLSHGPMPVAETCDILDGIARALEAAHAKEIIHRDLKPDNVFLHQVDNGPMMVKLLDFGIAKLVRTNPGQEKTQTGNMLGTPRYISPEQARGIQVDHRSDIYSLGVIAYEMLAGRPPFDGETAMDLVVKHLNEDAPPLSQFVKVPRNLEQCVMRMLAKDAKARPSLEEIRGILVDPTRRLTPVPRSTAHAMPKSPAKPRWPLLLGAVVLVAAAGVATWKLVLDKGDDKPAAVASEAPVPVEKQVPEVKQPEQPVQPAASAPAPVERGTLEVEVKGAKDSTIYVDGEEWGRGASVKVPLEPGTHEIKVKPPGRAAIVQTTTIESGQSNKLTIVVPKEKTIVIRRGSAKTQPKETPPPPPSDDALLAPKKRKGK